MPLKIEAEHLDLAPLVRKILAKNPISPLGLANALGVSIGEINGIIEKLDVTWHGALVTLARIPSNLRIPLDVFGDQWQTYGLVADTHLCSTFAREDALQATYDIFEQEGITTVFHAGNMIDGYVPRINGDSVICTSMDDQTQYVIDNYPRLKNGVTRYISADDHEGWFQKEGVNWGNYLQLLAQQQGRHDLVYMGHVEADVEFKNEGGSAIMKVQHPGGGCFIEGAEIMTQRGWVDFRNLTLDDSTATMSKETGFFEWQQPTAITAEPYVGDVYRFKARCFDFTVTPNHGLWTRHQRAYMETLRPKSMPQKGHGQVDTTWVRLEAADLAAQYSRQRWAFRTSCDGWIGKGQSHITIPRREPINPGNKHNVEQMQHLGKQSTMDVVELIGWYVTEGYANHKTVTLSQCPKANPVNHLRIKTLLTRMGLRYSCSECSKDVHICCTELAEYLRAECGSGSYHKFLPLWVKNLPTEYLRRLVEVMVEGDGWVDGDSFHYKSHSRRLRDDMSEIALKIGFGVATNEDHCTVHLRTVQNTPTVNERPEKLQYNGYIYCATVPNGLIYVRMNGKAFWSHNSSYARSYTSQKMIESLQGGEKPNILVQGHYHVGMNFFERNIHLIGLPGFKDQDIFARKLRLRYEVGAAILRFKQNPLDGNITRLSVEWIPFIDRAYYKAFLQSDKKVARRIRITDNGTKTRKLPVDKHPRSFAPIVKP